MKRNDVTHGYWIRSENPEEQLKEIMDRFDLKGEIQEFSRCLGCNTKLIQVEKGKIIERLPPKVKLHQNEFHLL